MNSDFKDLLQALNDAQAEYLVVGGYAVGMHTEPRYTKDLDVWLNNSPENAPHVLEALRIFGGPTGSLTVDDLTQEDAFYQIGVEPVRVDLILTLNPLNFSECWETRAVFEIDGVPINFISIDDLIKNKEATGRPLDLVDAANLRKKLEMFK
jgi:hypothetical protein